MNAQTEELRDQFAIAAMQAIISTGRGIPLAALAELAYAQADAMIDERNRRFQEQANKRTAAMQLGLGPKPVGNIYP